MPALKVSRVEGRPRLPLPSYATEGAAGLDLSAAERYLLEPGRWAAVPTGLQIEIPDGYEGQVRPRSGLAVRQGITVLNAPGTIDADYRGELKVVLINHGPNPHTIEVGDRIAQLVIAPVQRVQIAEVPVLSDSARGSGGFGHTGR